MSKPVGSHESYGLSGTWLSRDEINELAVFKGGKRAFNIKLNVNLAPVANQAEPGIKAIVRREFKAGDIICRAGDYGSTAFLLVEGRATATIPSHTTGSAVPGRTAQSPARWRQMFRRHAKRRGDPDAVAVGEVSRFGAVTNDRPPLPMTLVAGDVFGIDTCINFYPREATVHADEACVVVEMLRSVLDTIRDAGAAGAQLDTSYEHSAIRNQLYMSPLFQALSAEQISVLAEASELLVPDSDQVREGVLYHEGETAEGLYLVRAGTIKLSQQKAGGELIFSYLSRGAAFGLESIIPIGATRKLCLQCISHPSAFASVDLGTALTIGRSRACDLILPPDNLGIGRRHCRIETRGGELHLVDLGSANSTLLNGEPIQDAILTAGDEITVVDYTFKLTRQAGASTDTPTHFATATALDNFEVVRVPRAALQDVARSNERFLATTAAAVKALESSVEAAIAAAPPHLQDLLDHNLHNSQNVLLIDLDRCTRCDQCVRACATAHDGVPRFTRDGPRVGQYLVTMACRSCTDPKCMVGCPVGSIRRKDSLEIHIEDWCIGCERCANQCPFGNINMLELPAAAAATHPVDAAAPAALRATVCDLCAGYDGPNCVYACPHDAAIRVNPSEFFLEAGGGGDPTPSGEPGK